MHCRYFLQGICRFGDQCRYAHIATPLGKGPLPPLCDPRPVCTYFLAGSCRFGEACNYSHSAPGCGKKSGKKGKKGNEWKGAKGQGSGKFHPLDREDWQAGKGPGGQGLRPGGCGDGHAAWDLTGPHLGKGSELKKVWSMPDDVGHEDGVHAAIVMGDRVCSGSADQWLVVWRVEQPQTGGLSFVQDNEINFPAAVTALLFHAASRWLFCGLASGQITAFRQEPFTELALPGHSAAVRSFCIHESVLLSGSSDGTVRAWKFDVGANSFQCVATIPCSLGEVFAVHVRADIAGSAGGGTGGGIWLGAERGISCLNQQSLESVGSLQSAARTVALLPYQGRVIAVFANGVIKVYGDNGEEFSHGPLGEHTTNTAAALMRHPFANKDLLLCGQELGYVTVYEIPEFRPRGTFTTGYEGDVSVILDLGADGIFATFGLSGDVVLWRWEPNG